MMDNIDNENSSDSQPEFVIQHIYVKDLSLEAPLSPQAFRGEWQPELNLQFTMNTQDMGESNHEVVLQVTITAKSKEKTLFLVEVKQAGLFNLKGFTEEQHHQLINIACPTILFPYAREAVSYLVGRAGFPPLYLAPVSFEALYAQQQMQKEGGSLKNGNSSNSITTH